MGSDHGPFRMGTCHARLPVPCCVRVQLAIGLPAQFEPGELA
jgi:hypothetical protein